MDHFSGEESHPQLGGRMGGRGVGWEGGGEALAQSTTKEVKCFSVVSSSRTYKQLAYLEPIFIWGIRNLKTCKQHSPS